MVAVAAGAFVACPDGSWFQTGAFVAIGLGAAGAILAGVRIHRPEAAAPWRLFALGVAMNALGSLVDSLLWNLRGQRFPDAADIFYFGLYPSLVLGLVLLVRRSSSGRSWSAAVDATTLSTGMGLLSWVFVVRPAIGDPTLSLAGRALSAAYPLGDVLLLAMLVRLVVSAARTELAVRLIALSLVLFLVDDTAWAVCNRVGWEPDPWASRLLQLTVLGAYVSLGVAALHRSMAAAGEPGAARRQELSRTMLALLTVASLIAPAILCVEAVRGGVVDGLAIAFGSATLFLLVVTRMAQLLRQVEGQAGQLRELALSDELTGLPNRRTWGSELSHALERARFEGMPLSVVMIDLDGFKQFNDTFGHLAGDRFLRKAAEVWTARLRPADRLGRYGGEEFIVTLPGAGADEACEVVMRMRLTTPLGQTFSAGVATWDEVETSDGLVARADGALYEAKRSGRNCTVVASGEGRSGRAGVVA